jgi:hypothetical protein
MVDPLSLAALGAVALTEGVKFLYGQATELMKRRRDRRDAARKDEAAAEALPAAAEALPAAPEGLLDGSLAVPGDVAVSDADADMLIKLRSQLSAYADGLEPIRAGDAELLKVADALRGLLEGVYGRRITFVGEPSRSPTGTPLDAAESAGVRQQAGAIIASGERAAAVGVNPGVIATGDNAHIQR